MHSPKVLTAAELYKLMAYYISLRLDGGTRYIVSVSGMIVQRIPQVDDNKFFYPIFNMLKMDKAEEKDFTRPGILFDDDKMFIIDTDLEKHEVETIRLEKGNYITLALVDYPMHIYMEIAKFSKVSTVSLNKFFNA